MVHALFGDHFQQVPTMELLMDSISPFPPLRWHKWESNMGLLSLESWRREDILPPVSNLAFLLQNLGMVFVTDFRVRSKGTSRAYAKANSCHLF